METCVIVGAGQAACQFVSTLRSKNFSGKIVLIGNEKYIPYERPPLSKDFLSGEMLLEKIYLRPEAYYDQKNIELRLGVNVDEIDRRGQMVKLNTGERISYDKLVLATGARARKIHVPGANLDGVHYLRSINDVLSITDDLKKHSGRNVIIVGGGYIGLEVSAMLKTSGCSVTVIEAQDRIMARSVAPEISKFYQGVHHKAGVKLVLNQSVKFFEGDGRLENVITENGDIFKADIVVVGIGVIPNTELAELAGLDVDNGILVDEYCHTSDKNIYSIGDVTFHYNSLLDLHLRLESVPNAVSQGKTAALSICGESVPYSEIPWFWSDQYDLKLQIVGLAQPDDQFVIRGDMNSRKFSGWYLRDGKITAVNAINNPKDFLVAKKLILAGSKVTIGQILDKDFNLKSLLDNKTLP